MGGGNSEAQRAHESRQQLRLRYRHQVLESNPDQRGKNREALLEEVMTFMYMVPVFILRLCHVSLEVFNKNREEANWHLADAAKALIIIERFALNLWDHPWKKELRNIKQYTGLYKGHIDRNLKGSELYFHLIGYEVLPGKVLKLNQLKKDQVADAAFEIYLDQAYFTYLGEIYKLVCDQGFTLMQVWSAREKYTGSPKEVAGKMKAELKPPITTVGIDPTDIDIEIPEKSAPQKVPVQACQTVAGKDSGCRRKAASREISEEELQKVKVELQDALKKKLAETPQQRNEPVTGKDSGYVSKPTSREISVAELDKMRAKDSGLEKLSKQLGSLSQQREVYQPATIDEHVGMSLRALQEREGTCSRATRDSGIVEGHDHRDSWSYVNDELSKRHQQEDSPDMLEDSDDDHQRPGYLHLKTNHFQTAQDQPAAEARNKYKQGKPNGLALSIESPPDGDLWAFSPPSGNIKPLVAIDGIEDNSNVNKYLREEAKPPQEPQLGFSTFGKEPSGQNSQQLRRFKPYDPNCYSSLSQPDMLDRKYSPYETPIGGDIQSDSVDCDDKVGQLLWKTEKQIDETLQMQPRSKSSYANDAGGNFYSLPSVSSSKPAVVRRNMTESIATKHSAADPSSAVSRGSRVNISAPWQCQSCTFINTELKMVCQICAKSRDLNSELTALRSGMPQCPKCTLVNENGGSRCKACGEPLKGCPTYF